VANNVSESLQPVQTLCEQEILIHGNEPRNIHASDICISPTAFSVSHDDKELDPAQ